MYIITIYIRKYERTYERRFLSSFPERQRGNLKIETKRSIFSVRVSDFWASLNTRTLSKFRGKKVTIKLKEDKRGRRQTTRENPVPPLGHEYVSVIVRLHRLRCSRQPLSDNATPLFNGTRVKFHFARHIHDRVTKRRGFLIAVPSPPHILKYYAMKDLKSAKVFMCVCVCVCKRELYRVEEFTLFDGREENKSVER